MKKPKILISVPSAFSVRAVLMTKFIDNLSTEVDVEVITAFSTDKKFNEIFGGKGIPFHPYLEYDEHQGNHAKWLRRLRNANTGKWDLFVTKHLDRQNHYFTAGIDVADKSDKTGLWKQIIGRLTRNDFSIKLLKTKENYEFLKQYSSNYLFDYKRIFQNVNPDIILSTFPSIIRTVPFLKAAQYFKIPCLYYVLSHDNVTTKKNLPIDFRKYFVWNDRNKNELLTQYSHIKQDQISLCGPLSFDWYNPSFGYEVPKEEWLRKNSLDKKKKIILFGSVVERAAPMDPYVLSELVKANKCNKFIEDVQFMVRLHPHDNLKRWGKIIKEYPEIPFVPSMSLQLENGTYIAEENDLKSLVNDLKHSALVLTTFSSIALDACRVNKPAIFIGFDEHPGSIYDEIAHSFYKREHIYPQVDIGGVKVAVSLNDLIGTINEYLKKPEKDEEKRIKTALHYDPFMDGRASERLTNHILEYLHDSKRKSLTRCAY